MTLKIYKHITILLAVIATIAFSFTQTGCVYRFKDVSIPDSVRVFKLNYIQNKAAYINPQLSQMLTEKVRQKIVSQTKLRETKGDDADWEISGTITNYSFSTSGISAQKVNMNNLNVGVHIDVLDRKSNKTSKYDVTRSFPYEGSMSVQQAESQLNDEMIRSLSDDIFNRLFSNW